MFCIRNHTKTNFALQKGITHTINFLIKVGVHKWFLYLTRDEISHKLGSRITFSVEKDSQHYVIWIKEWQYCKCQWFICFSCTCQEPLQISYTCGVSSTSSAPSFFHFYPFAPSLIGFRAKTGDSVQGHESRDVQ